MINGFIDTLDIEDATTEPTEILLDSHKLVNEVETSRGIGRLFEHYVGDMGSEYRRMVKARDFLLARNKMLSEEHIDHVNTGIAIEKLIEESKGSLIADFANTSTEMPSYMDPED